MGYARKYILNLSNVFSCGLGVYSGGSQQYNLLNSFNYTATTTSMICNYPQITVNELKALSYPEYEDRVSDYIEHIGVEDSTVKVNLIDTSSEYVSICEDTCCGLNDNFLVYKFLTGVRIIDVGTPQGELEYKIYPSTENSELYLWKTSATFLNLDVNGIYIAEVRDVLDGVVVCTVNHIFSMAALGSSTTLSPQSKIVSIYELNNSDGGEYKYTTGQIFIEPSLSISDVLTITYGAIATHSGVDSDSCVIIKCKENGASSFEQIACYVNTESTHSGFNLCYGDTVCYTISNKYGCDGSSSYGALLLVGASGFNLIPTIDPALCCASVCIEAQYIEIGITLASPTTIISNLTNCSYSGAFNISNTIPVGQCATIKMSSTNYIDNGTSITTYYCKKCGTSQYLVKETNTNSETQPQENIFNICNGDAMCYAVNLTAPSNGTYADSLICIVDISGSVGINTYMSEIKSDNCIYRSINQGTVDTTVGICNLVYGGNGTSTCYGSGNITICPSLGLNSSIDVCYEAGLCGSNGFYMSYVSIHCKANNSADFVQIQCITDASALKTCKFTMKYGDEIKYCMNAIAGTSSTSKSEIVLFDTISSVDINSSISSVKFRDCIEITNEI